MRKKLIAAAYLISMSLAGTAAASAQTIPSEFKKAVTFIFLADGNGNLRMDGQGNPAAYGTGFFVGVKGDDGKGEYGYLVTAKHVLHDEHGGDLQKVFVRLNTKDGGFKFVGVDLVQNGKSVVYTDPDPTVDIAAVSAFPRPDIFDFKVVPDDMISTKATFNNYNVSEGTDVFFIGLFVTYYGEHRTK